jgi:hypothetical protein
MRLIPIVSDVHDIADRLKEIDWSYRLYYNALKKRFEVHGASGLEVVVPYKELDARTLLHVRKTRLENAERLILEIERDNARAERENAQKIIAALCADEDKLCR